MAQAFYTYFDTPKRVHVVSSVHWAHIAGRLNSGFDREIGALPPHIYYINCGGLVRASGSGRGLGVLRCGPWFRFKKMFSPRSEKKQKPDRFHFVFACSSQNMGPIFSLVFFFGLIRFKFFVSLRSKKQLFRFFPNPQCLY
jgi:hypothetical protein